MATKKRPASKRKPSPRGHAPAVNWEKAALLPQFQKLVAAKAGFIAPAFAFFVIYYFALPISVGYFPEVMNRKVWGAVNLAYVFALSQFLMAWVLAALYVRAASRFDASAAHVAMLAVKKAGRA